LLPPSYQENEKDLESAKETNFFYSSKDNSRLFAKTKIESKRTKVFKKIKSRNEVHPVLIFWNLLSSILIQTSEFSD